MPRFYFHACTNGDWLLDEEGFDFATPEMAYNEAAATLVGLLGDASKSADGMPIPLTMTMRVREENEDTPHELSLILTHKLG